MNWNKLKESVLALVLRREPLPKDPKEAPTKGKTFVSATCADQMYIKPNKIYPVIGGLYENAEEHVVEVINIKQGIIYYADADRCHDCDLESLSCIIFNSLFTRHVVNRNTPQSIPHIKVV